MWAESYQDKLEECYIKKRKELIDKLVKELCNTISDLPLQSYLIKYLDGIIPHKRHYFRDSHFQYINGILDMTDGDSLSWIRTDDFFIQVLIGNPYEVRFNTSIIKSMKLFKNSRSLFNILSRKIFLELDLDSAFYGVFSIDKAEEVSSFLNR